MSEIVQSWYFWGGIFTIIVLWMLFDFYLVSKLK